MANPDHATQDKSACGLGQEKILGEWHRMAHLATVWHFIFKSVSVRFSYKTKCNHFIHSN